LPDRLYEEFLAIYADFKYCFQYWICREKQNKTKKMKRLILFIFLVATGITGIKAQEFDSTNIYFRSLTLHLKYWNDFHNERPDLVKKRDVFYIEQNEFITRNFPTEIRGQRIEILSAKEIYKKTKNRKHIGLVVVRPASWSNGKLTINVVDVGVSRKNRHYYYLTSGGSEFQIIGDSTESKIGLKILYQGGI